MTTLVLDVEQVEKPSGWSWASYALKGAWLLRIAAKCRWCGRFKPRPSSLCDYCGNCGVRVGQCPYEFDRENGWDWYA